VADELENRRGRAEIAKNLGYTVDQSGKELGPIPDKEKEVGAEKAPKIEGTRITDESGREAKEPEYRRKHPEEAGSAEETAITAETQRSREQPKWGTRTWTAGAFATLLVVVVVAICFHHRGMWSGTRPSQPPGTGSAYKEEGGGRLAGDKAAEGGRLSDRRMRQETSYREESRQVVRYQNPDITQKEDFAAVSRGLASLANQIRAEGGWPVIRDYSRRGDSLWVAAQCDYRAGGVICYLGGCCYGCLMTGLKIRHPVQLYEAVSLMIIAGIVAIAERRSHDASLLIYFLSYSSLRFLLEFLRADDRSGAFGMSTSQLLSVPLFLVGALLFLRVKSVAAS